MNTALIQGQPTGLDEAVARAASLLGSARLPVVAGLATDVAGARAAIRLAERLGAAIDHAASDGALRNLSAMRDRGMLTVTPDEARRRADILFLVGPMPGARQAAVLSFLLSGRPEPGSLPGGEQFLIALCPGHGTAGAGPLPNMEIVSDDPQDCLVLLSSLRARVNGRPCSEGPVAGEVLDALTDRLKAARYGVAVWSAETLPALGVEMLAGLVTDLNAGTRWAGLPLPPPGNEAGVDLVSGWMSGYPVRTGFGRGVPEHDPWAFDARRLVESGEADALLWISALDDLAPDWTADLPIVALVAGEDAAPPGADVVIPVARPGRDHDAVLFDARLGTLSSVRAASTSEHTSVAEIVGRIAGALT